MRRRSKLYTGTGDKGKTRLYNNEEISKSSIRCNALGALDKLNSVIGQIRSKLSIWKLGYTEYCRLKHVLITIQASLLDIGSYIGYPGSSTDFMDGSREFVELYIDHYDSLCPPLKNFILPYGDFDIMRVECRSTERIIIALHKQSPLEDCIIIFINRLSDLFFAITRYLNIIYYFNYLNIFNEGEIIYKKTMRFTEYKDNDVNNNNINSKEDNNICVIS